VFLDSAEKAADLPIVAQLQGYKKEGVQIAASPFADPQGWKLVATRYAKNTGKASPVMIT